MKKVDLAIVKMDGYPKNRILVVAPAYTSPYAGTEVVIEDDGVLERATMVMDNTVDVDSDEYKNTLKVMGASEPLPKLVKIIRFSDVNWSDYEEEKEEDEDE